MPHLTLPVEIWTNHGHHYITLQGHPHLSVGSPHQSRLRILLRTMIEEILRKAKPRHLETERLLITAHHATILVEQHEAAFRYITMSPLMKRTHKKTGFQSYKDAIQAARQMAYESYGGVIWEQRLV